MDDKNKILRSFGRRKSRKLSDRQQHLVDELLPKYEFKEFAAEKNFLEIGFGGGEFIFAQSSNNPQNFYLACEPFLNGVAKLLSNLDEAPQKNIAICADDYLTIAEKIPPESLDGIFVLFPDPWPKARQAKKRLFNKAFLGLAHNWLKLGGFIHLATDNYNYSAHALDLILKDLRFDWPAKSCKDWTHPPHYWANTKYELKQNNHGEDDAVHLLFYKKSFSRHSPA